MEKKQIQMEIFIREILWMVLEKAMDKLFLLKVKLLMLNLEMEKLLKMEIILLVVKIEVTFFIFVEIDIEKKVFFNIYFFSTLQLTTINNASNQKLLIIMCCHIIK